MRSSTVVALFAGSAAAQSSTGSGAAKSSAVVFNPIMPTGTLTVIGSSEGTTTYVNSCSANAGIPASYLTPEASGSATPSSGSVKPSSATAVRSSPTAINLTPIPAPSVTAAARLRRQDRPYGDFCEPITIKQGASSMQYHLQDPLAGAWTADMNCAWKGELTAADLTCTVTQSGTFAEIIEAAGVTSTVIKASEVAEASMLQTAAVVTGAATPTASGSQPAGNGTASGSAPGATATGAAAGGPVPMGAMAFVGGAAGMFVAALAL